MKLVSELAPLYLGKKLPEFMATGMSEEERRCQSLPVLYQPYKMVHLVRNPVSE